MAHCSSEVHMASRIENAHGRLKLHVAFAIGRPHVAFEIEGSHIAFEIERSHIAFAIGRPHIAFEIEKPHRVARLCWSWDLAVDVRPARLPLRVVESDTLRVEGIANLLPDETTKGKRESQSSMLQKKQILWAISDSTNSREKRKCWGASNHSITPRYEKLFIRQTVARARASRGPEEDQRQRKNHANEVDNVAQYVKEAWPRLRERIFGCVRACLIMCVHA
eukprot:2078690-Pleurochrysis_carterae.AAC.2